MTSRSPEAPHAHACAYQYDSPAEGRTFFCMVKGEHTEHRDEEGFGLLSNWYLRREAMPVRATADASSGIRGIGGTTPAEAAALRSASAPTAGETWAKGFRAGEAQAAEWLGEAGHYEAARLVRARAAEGEEPRERISASASATVADAYRDIRCPECGEMMTSHVVRTRHATGPCEEAFHGPELRTSNASPGTGEKP